MEACVVVCRMKKPPERKLKIIFIKAVNEVTRERAQSFIEEWHMQKILKAYRNFKDIEGFAKVVNIEEIKSNNSNLSVQLYVRSNGENNNNKTLKDVLYEWQESSENLKTSTRDLFMKLKEMGFDE